MRSNSGRRGFAAMDPEERRRISRKGGLHSHGGSSRYDQDRENEYDEDQDNEDYEDEEDDRPYSRYGEEEDDYDEDEDEDYDEDEDENETLS